MCGILALLWKSPNALNAFKESLKLQEHRGPDETRFVHFSNQGLLIGSNRLAILDQIHGSQPLLDSDQNIALSFNGEIFNSKQLRKELNESGVEFSSNHSDTEVILRGYQKYGIDFFSSLQGMFAIIVIDKSKSRIIGVRDRFGIKPFHYFKEEKVLVMSSELSPLVNCIKAAGFETTINLDAVREYLQVGFISTPSTIYSKVKTLKPGHLIEFDLENQFIREVKWSKQQLRSGSELDPVFLPSHVRSHLIEAVERWTYSDFPLALSLSGGLDSTCILIACKLLGTPIETFSLVFEDPKLQQWSESKNIETIVRAFGGSHNSILLDATGFLNSLNSIVQSLGQPYGGGLPSYRVFEAVSKTHRVCLTGVGGDELFGNYHRRKFVGLNEIANQKELDTNYTQVIYKSRVNLLQRIFPHLDFSQDINNWFCFYSMSNSRNLEERLASVDINSQLPDEFLFVTDRLSMKYSVEARTPYLDDIFAEDILSIESEIRHASPYKYLLRSAFSDELKRLGLEETKKGFSLPLSIWLRSELREWAAKNLFSSKLMEILKVDFEALLKVYEDFLTGNNENILLIWKITMLGAWLESTESI